MLFCIWLCNRRINPPIKTCPPHNECLNLPNLFRTNFREKAGNRCPRPPNELHKQETTLSFNLFEIALIAVALGCDAFAVGLGIGCRFCGPRQIFRLSFHFGLFQFMMPLIGWLSGHHILAYAKTWGPWMALRIISSAYCIFISSGACIGGKLALTSPSVKKGP